MRAEGWEGRLAAFLEAARTRPFAWGTFDCCLFACDGVEALTGTDPAARLRGRYQTPRGALGALRRFAGAGVEAAAEKIAAALDAPEIAPTMAWRGDVVLVRDIPFVEAGFDAALALSTGGRAVLLTPDGLRAVPLRAAARAWRV